MFFRLPQKNHLIIMEFLIQPTCNMSLAIRISCKLSMKHGDKANHKTCDTRQLYHYVTVGVTIAIMVDGLNEGDVTQQHTCQLWWWQVEQTIYIHVFFLIDVNLFVAETENFWRIKYVLWNNGWCHGSLAINHLTINQLINQSVNQSIDLIKKV